MILEQEPSCPVGFYEAFPCTDQEGPKYCQRCKVCSAGQYQIVACNSTQDSMCKDCTRECPNGYLQSGIVGECRADGLDTVDAVQCVLPYSSRTAVLSTLGVGAACGANEWYVGTRSVLHPNQQLNEGMEKLTRC